MKIPTIFINNGAIFCNNFHGCEAPLVGRIIRACVRTTRTGEQCGTHRQLSRETLHLRWQSPRRGASYYIPLLLVPASTVLLSGQVHPRRNSPALTDGDDLHVYALLTHQDRVAHIVSILTPSPRSSSTRSHARSRARESARRAGETRAGRREQCVCVASVRQSDRSLGT